MIERIHRRMAERRNDEGQGGFTLIELMVVVMIIAILVGIAIPAFLGARKRAQESAAKSNLRNALGTAQTIFSDTQSYLGVTEMVASLTSDEPSFTFIEGADAADPESDKPKVISVSTGSSSVGTDDLIILAAKSDSGKCFFIRHVASSGVANLSGSYSTSTEDTCNAASAPAVDAVDAPTPVWKAI